VGLLGLQGRQDPALTRKKLSNIISASDVLYRGGVRY